MSSKDGVWPVNSAVRDNSPTQLRFALDRGGSPDEKGWDAEPAVFRALRHGPDLAALLLQRHADVRALDQTGRTTLMTAFMHADLENANRILAIAPDLADSPGGTGLPPLFHLAHSGYAPGILLLSEHGACFSMKNSAGQTALVVAKEAMNDDAVLAIREGLANEFSTRHALGRRLPRWLARSLSKLRNTPLVFLGT